jgi:hypothetical protein
LAQPAVVAQCWQREPTGYAQLAELQAWWIPMLAALQLAQLGLLVLAALLE